MVYLNKKKTPAVLGLVYNRKLVTVEPLLSGQLPKSRNYFQYNTVSTLKLTNKHMKAKLFVLPVFIVSENRKRNALFVPVMGLS